MTWRASTPRTLPASSAAPSTAAPRASPREGHLVTTSVFSEQMKGVTSKLGSPSDEGSGLITVKATATGTDTAATTAVDASRPLPTDADTTGTEPAASAPAITAAADDVDPLTCGEGGPESQCPDLHRSRRVWACSLHGDALRGQAQRPQAPGTPAQREHGRVGGGPGRAR
ncbi:hypothetical protein ACRAWF_39940 [Streptomyces sp. L7]